MGAGKEGRGVEEGRVDDAVPAVGVGPRADEEDGARGVGMHVGAAQSDGDRLVLELRDLQIRSSSSDHMYVYMYTTESIFSIYF